MAKDKTLLRVKGLVKHFYLNQGFFGGKTVLRAVDNVSFHINRGETLGLVGESGCGKTTLGRTVLRLYEPTAGSIFFNGLDITALTDGELLPLRKRMQLIFQDPYVSLNALMTVGDIIGEPLEIHKMARGKQRRELVMELLHKVGLSPDHINGYPHEFSGGQRQRIGIARALAVNPDFIVCDEPVSALDVSAQAQVVNLLEDLQQELGLAYLFIAHDLSIAGHISNRIGVMYLGRLVELAASDDLYRNPLHPYTRALLSAIPVPDPDAAAQKQRIILKGETPSPIDPPDGCGFRTRCRYVREACGASVPEMVELAPNHRVACHLAGKV